MITWTFTLSQYIKMEGKKNLSGIIKNFEKKLKNPLDFDDNYTIIE